MTTTTDRRSWIGASDVAAILGLSSYRTPWETWLEKTGQLEPWGGNAATDLGNRIEPLLLDLAEEELGPIERQAVWQSWDYPILRATCDAVGKLQVGQASYEWTDWLVEAKTAGLLRGFASDQWGPDGSDQIPTEYAVQVQAQLLCSSRSVCHVYALLAGRGIVRYKLERDESIGHAIGTQCSEWWERHVVGGEPVPIEGTPPIDVLRRIKRTPEKVVDLQDHYAEWVQQWKDATEAESAARKIKEAAQAEIIAALGDAEIGRLPDGTEVTYLQTQRRGYTVAPTTYRQLRTRKGES